MPTQDQTGSQTPADETPQEQRALYRMGDDLIGMVRELVQLALLTGTNIVDHLRAVVVEVSTTEAQKITVCPEYVDAYNKMVSQLNDEAEKKMLNLQEKLAEDDAAGNSSSHKN